jgi:hypothetical protein
LQYVPGPSNCATPVDQGSKTHNEICRNIREFVTLPVSSTGERHDTCPDDRRAAQIIQIIDEYFMGLSFARYSEIAADVHGPDTRINDPAVGSRYLGQDFSSYQGALYLKAAGQDNNRRQERRVGEAREPDADQVGR